MTTIRARAVLALCAASALAAAAAPALAADGGLRVKDAAARLIVIPENRRDVQVTISGGDARLPRLTTHQEGNTMVVDGGLWNRIQGCGTINLNFGAVFHHEQGAPMPGQRVNIRGVGLLTLDHLPVITARVPMNTQVSAESAVWGEVGRTEALGLTTAGCGDWKVDDVRGPFDLRMSGSGDVAAHRAGSVHAQMSGSGGVGLADVDRDVELAMSGSGDVKAGRIGGRLNTRMSGSGKVVVARADGPVDAAIHGSGDVHVHDGKSPTVAVSVAGSGDFRYDGVAGALNAQVAGSGDVSVAHVTGPVSKMVAGSGEVHVGH